MTDAIQPLNYSAHALEQLAELSERFRQNGAERSAIAIDAIWGVLRESVKFLLPNCGELLDPQHLRETHLELLRLPFPKVAFEAPWIKDSALVETGGDFNTEVSTRRIALCWESSPTFEPIPGMNVILERYPAGGVFMVPIYWQASIKRFVPVIGGTFVPYENRIERSEDLPAPSQIAREALQDARRSKNSSLQFLAEPFVLLPELFEEAVRQLGSKEKALAQIIFNCHDETMMLVQACAVLNCANVEAHDLHPDAPINKKRTAKGQQPFFSYKVLHLRGGEGGSGGAGHGGTHSPPRMHLRRGHLRRLENRTTWVRATTVASGASRGVVAKDYAIEPPTS